MIATGIPTADFGAHTLIFVLDDSTSAALFAFRALAALWADADPSALLAPITPPAVRAEGATAALLAQHAHAAMWTAISIHSGW